jgi:hypothetical protein
MRVHSIFIAGMAVVLAPPLSAHHSDAGYNQDNVVIIQGTVMRFVWRNPHITVYIEVEDENGATTEWGIEAGSTPVMSRSGWTQGMLQPGDNITVRAYPDRNPDRKHVMMVSIQTADERVWIQDESDYQGTAAADSIEGVWKGRVSTIGPFREKLDQTPLTEAAEAARAIYDYRVDSPIGQCIPPPTPGVLTATAVYMTEIDIQEDRVVIRNEFFDNQRTIYTDGRGHPANGERTNQGHSVGRWEGDVLVVDTVLFADHPSTSGFGVPGGAHKHATERFELIEGGKRLEIDVWIEDPQYLAEPFNSSLQWDYTPELQLYRYNCDPALAGLG